MKRNLERATLAIVAFLTVAIMAASLHFERQLSNQKAMFYQLQAIRTSVNLYKAINRRNPENLGILVMDVYSFPGEEETRKYLHGMSANEKGELLDPFGNPYSYDYVSGWVRSSTPGYEYW